MGPNGLAFSPDESKLYITNTGIEKEQAPVMWVFDVQEDGSLSNKTLFHDFSENEGPGCPDGIEVDKDGNIYVSGPVGVYVFAADATLLGTIETGQIISNMRIGGEDDSTLFLTSSMFLYSLPLY